MCVRTSEHPGHPPTHLTTHLPVLLSHVGLLDVEPERDERRGQRAQQTRLTGPLQVNLDTLPVVRDINRNRLLLLRRGVRDRPSTEMMMSGMLRATRGRAPDPDHPVVAVRPHCRGRDKPLRSTRRRQHDRKTSRGVNPSSPPKKREPPCETVVHFACFIPTTSNVVVGTVINLHGVRVCRSPGPGGSSGPA